MDLKKPLSYDEQEQKLLDHGVIPCSEIQPFLQHVNYYRLTGYTLHLRKDSHSSELNSRIDFSEIYNLYTFDYELRSLLRKYLEIIEIYCKTQISNSFALEKCTGAPYDQHYNENNYYDKKGYQHVMETFNRERGYYSENLIVKHHNNKYSGKMPLWAMVELMSFSNVSKLYNAMYSSSQQLIANRFGIGRTTLSNHLHCMSVLRNKCSHCARLINSNFNPPAKLSPRFLQRNPTVNNSSLFAYLIVLKWRLPNEDLKVKFKSELLKLIEENESPITLSLIGFPANYKNIL
ncbi:abortive infection bacteriophage resistance protein [Moryella indoligenes]|uniref:Abortive infection bacteriophage resistance protein n=1 Tax=Moryella indoligenes TaxID=371674 RepID=A0AAE4AM14_9FIRM|nr:Abi family protein [Moryella indoligenes]MDQ0153699.1 abortive infection bacteriophage resistance protein [Moryella indoligenes]